MCIITVRGPELQHRTSLPWGLYHCYHQLCLHSHMATIHLPVDMDHLLGSALLQLVTSRGILNMDKFLDMNKLVSYHRPRRLNIPRYQNGLNIVTNIPNAVGRISVTMDGNLIRKGIIVSINLLGIVSLLKNCQNGS